MKLSEYTPHVQLSVKSFQIVFIFWEWSYTRERLFEKYLRIRIIAFF